jgi:hypothetical protein
MKLDKDTRGFLFLSIANLNLQLKNYDEARNNLLECYQIWKDTNDIYVIVEVLAKLGKVLVNSSHYSEVNKYSDIGISKIKDYNLDTKLAIDYCELYVNKSKVQRHCGNMKNALAFLSEAERILEPFKDAESEGIYYEYAVVYQQYLFIYSEVGKTDLCKKYSIMDMEITKKTYEIAPSMKNFKSLSFSYVGLADYADTHEEEKSYYDSAIDILKQIFIKQPGDSTFNEYFNMVARAMQLLSKSQSKYYYEMSKEIIEKYPQFKLTWKMQYSYQEKLIIYYVAQDDYTNAINETKKIETLLCHQKDRLPEIDYLSDLAWINKEWAIIYYYTDELYKSIQYAEHENSIRYRVFTKYSADGDGYYYSESCRLLANLYSEKNLMAHALHYAQEQIKIVKSVADEFQSIKKMKQLRKSLRILAVTYEKNYSIDKAIEVYKQELEYAKMIYEKEHTESNLLSILDINRRTVKYKMARGQYDQIIKAYKEMLTEFSSDQLELRNENDRETSEQICDYLQCILAKVSYLQNSNLEKAREVMAAAQCSIHDFSNIDRNYYMGKIESRLLDKMIIRCYLSKEDGLKLLAE